MAKWETKDLGRQFELQQELESALGQLGIGSPTIPPVPGSPAHQIKKANFIMEKSEAEKAVGDIVDLRLIRQSLNRMLSTDATDEQREAALRTVPAIIAAVIKAAKNPAKDEKVEYDSSLN